MKGDDLVKRVLFQGWGEQVCFLALSQIFPLADSFERDLTRMICSLFVRRRTRMPLISAALCVCVLWGLDPAVTPLDVSSQALLGRSEKLCSCWNSVGTNQWTPWKYLLALFLCYLTAKLRFPAAIQFGIKHWDTVARELYKQRV